MKSRMIFAAALVLLFAFSTAASAAPMELRSIFDEPDAQASTTPAATLSPTPIPTPVPTPMQAPLPTQAPVTVTANGLSGVIPLLPPGMSEEALKAQQGQAVVSQTPKPEEGASPASSGAPNAAVAMPNSATSGAPNAASAAPVDAAQVEQLLISIRDNPSKYQYSYEEIWLVARLIYAEGHDQTYESFQAMASVIYNRLKSKKFPNSIEKIIFARSQFTVVDDEGFATDIPTSPAFSAVLEVFLNDKPTLPAEIVYFRSERDEKKWGKRVYFDTIDGNMYYS